MKDVPRFSKTYLDAVVTALERHGARFEPGLATPEIVAIEKSCSMRFPPDIEGFLRHAVPCGERFPAWRGAAKDLRSWFRSPLEGILFDIEFNDFWAPSWGDRPNDLGEANKIATARFDDAPTLIPLYGHRFLPAEPRVLGNPVLSVHQTDIIVYGNDLPGYLSREFEVPSAEYQRSHARPIVFWDELIELNGTPSLQPKED